MVFFIFFMLLNFLGFYFGKGIPSRLLAVFAFVNVVLIAASMSLSGEVALWSLLAVGLFNSIMWSNVFTLAIEGLEPNSRSLVHFDNDDTRRSSLATFARHCSRLHRHKILISYSYVVIRLPFLLWSEGL